MQSVQEEIQAQLLTIVKLYQDKYLNGFTSSRIPDFGLAMIETQTLLKLINYMYSRLQRNRPYYLPVEKVQWEGEIYNWFKNYLNTTNPQEPISSIPVQGTGLKAQRLSSMEDAILHFENTFDETFGAADTYNSRHARLMMDFKAANGEDEDYYWSYRGQTGGPHLRPLVLPFSMSDNIQAQHDVIAYQNRRNFDENPAAMYGKLFREQEQKDQDQAGTRRDLYRTINPNPYLLDNMFTPDLNGS